MLDLRSYLLNDIKPLQLQETVQEALATMEELDFKELPVEEAGEYLGLVGENTLYEADDPDGSLLDLKQFLKTVFVSPEAHLFEAIRLCSEHQIALLPVVEQQQYKGYLSLTDLAQDMGSKISFRDPGGLLELHMTLQDYSHVQIAQIVESEDAKITALLTYAISDNEIGVVLKINQKDLSRIIQAFKRYNYEVGQVYHETLFDDSGERSLDSLISYLKV